MSRNEAKIYETVLENWRLWVSDIANKSEIHRRSVYDTIKRLIEKWMLFQVFESRENLYEAVSPQKLYEVLKEKENTFTRILPYLQKLQKNAPYKEAAFIYKGIEGYKNYMRDMTRVADDCYFLGAKWNWITPGIPLSFEENFQEAMKRKWKKIQILFDPRVRSRKDILDKTSADYKFLPEGYETPGIVDVFWDYVVTFKSAGIWNFWENGTIFVMINAELAESYRTWFRFIWDFCPED